MSQMWLDKLRDAPTKVDRDDVLLREFREHKNAQDGRKARLREEVEDQLRALADIAFPKTPAVRPQQEGTT